VPKWTPRSERDRKMEQYAMRIAELRQKIKDDMAGFLDPDR